MRESSGERPVKASWRKILSGIDDHSRFCVSAGISRRATMRPICAGSTWLSSVTEVVFDKICRENDIVHFLTSPRSPTTTGKIGRFHRSLHLEFLSGQIGTDATCQCPLPSLGVRDT